MSDKIFNVLFLCTGNSARSILGEAVMNKLGAGRFKAWSAGSQPKGEVHPMALSVLEGMGYDTTGMYSKSWSEFSLYATCNVEATQRLLDAARDTKCPHLIHVSTSSVYGKEAAEEGDDTTLVAVQPGEAVRNEDVLVKFMIDGILLVEIQ